MIKFKIKGLNELEKEFRDNFKSASVEWGYGPNSGYHEDGRPYSEIAAAHEYGAPRNKMYNNKLGHPAPIPQRDFFTQTVERTGKLLQPEKEIIVIKKGIFNSKRLIEYIVKSLQMTLASVINYGNFEPNSEATIAKKGFNKPLVETGGLADAAKVQGEIKVYKV